MNAEIISIGTELLLGEIVDTNSAHIARRMRDIGLNLYFTTTVGDNETRIIEAFNNALDRADVVISTGGLGPTVDDVTRPAVAAATSRELVFQQELYDQIADRFARFGSAMPENNRLQAYIPDGAIPIENPVGTAPCYIVESDRGVVISLPGVPREMKHLLEHNVIPYLQQQLGLTSIIKARVLRTAGIGESTIDEAIADLMILDNPTVGLAAHVGQTDVRITAKADTESEADQIIATIEAQIRGRIGDYIYGVDKEKMEDAFLSLLHQKRMACTLLEVGMGTAVNDQLFAQDGAADVLQSQLFDDITTLANTIGISPSEEPEQFIKKAALYAYEGQDANLGIALVGQPNVIMAGVCYQGKTLTRIYRYTEEDAPRTIWAITWSITQAWRWMTN